MNVIYEFDKKLLAKAKSGAKVVAKVYSKANSFKELVNLIKAAEQKMISADITDIDDRISMLRGIYYGTPWSMDYQVEKSDVRNAGFQVYTASLMPDDIRPIIGKDLFNALLTSSEVKDGNRAIDFGHAIIGLHARRQYSSRKIPLPTGGTGLEASTWVGDLGGGAGMLAYKRTKNPQLRAKIIFQQSHDYGAPVNLEGDIAGFLVGCDDSEDEHSLDVSISDSQLIADAFNDYFDINNSWHKRVYRFLKKYNAQFDNSKNIINQKDLLQKFSDIINNFAHFYIAVRLKDKNLMNVDTLYKTFNNIEGAAHEIAEIFLSGLISTYQKGNMMFTSISDPNPTPPSQSSTWDKIDEMLNKIEDFF